MKRLVAGILCFASAVYSQDQPIAESGWRTDLAPVGVAGTAKAAVNRGKRGATSTKNTASVTLLSSVVTPSPAESFAINGSVAYVCDNNEVAVVNISNPQSLSVVSTALSGFFQNSALTYCSIQRNTLTVFSDQVSTTVGNTPGFSAFSLANPNQPQLIKSTGINKRFFQSPVYIGNTAYVPTAANIFFGGYLWDGQYGDLVAIDVNNFSAPAISSTLEIPLADGYNADLRYGGGTAVFGATQADSALLYLGGSTSTGATNNGTGRLQVVDVSNPAALKVVAQRLIPGSIHFYAPLVQGTLAVGIGNTGGYNASAGSNPVNQGSIVVAVFDASDRRAPAILSLQTTSFKVGPGGGATPIGANLFAFAGVVDANGNNVMLIVDASNPLVPTLQPISIPQPFSSMQSIGSVLYATLGSGGFAAYSIPGIASVPGLSCPTAVDTILVLDRGMNVSGQAFLDAKSALKAYLANLRFPSDQVGVASFTNFANLDQTLTTASTLVNTAFDAIIPGGQSYIGSGIAAAQAELTGVRRNASAQPVIILVSDGVDAGAPSGSATTAAAAAAKAAGIRIVSVQYGAGTSSLMQSLASSSSDYYVVSP